MWMFRAGHRKYAGSAFRELEESPPVIEKLARHAE
jgi:hypothetical protein